MSTNRFATIVLVIGIAILAAATASFASPKAPQPLDDFALRHPAGLPQPSVDLAVYYRGSDYAERHPANSINTSDYALRHPEWVFAAQAIDTSDYFLRHPEWTAALVVDTSDYFLRHP